MTLKEMLERRNAVNAELKSTEEKRSKDKDREFSAEEKERVTVLMDERTDLDGKIAAKQKEQNDQWNTRFASMLATAGNDGGSTHVRGPEPRASCDPVDNPDGAKYSVLRAIRMRAEGKEVDGYEGEISQEIAKRSGKSAQGFFLPLSLPMEAERRDFDTTAGAGAIQTTKLYSRFIDMLRNRMTVAAMGATFLTDMVGPFEIPKQTGTGAAYWVTEGNSPTESAQAIGQVAFTPKTVGAFTDITRKFLKQTSMDGERFARNDLARVLGLETDRAAYNGSGSGAEPTGILQNGSITTVAIATDGGAPTWEKIVALESTVAAVNADVGGMGYVTSAVGRGKLKTTVKVSNFPEYLWGRDNMVNGYRAVATNQIPSNLTKGSGTNLTAMIFGDFSTVHIAMWGGVDVLVDPYSLSTAGSVRVVCLLDTDIKFRNTESLAKIVDMVRT
jgi:HK97 family phage major capsid protein